MSHFVTLVLVDRKTENKMEALEEAIGPILAPYDENKQVPSYQTRCYCVGRAAQKEVQEKIVEKYGEIDRDAFYARPDVKAWSTDREQAYRQSHKKGLTDEEKDAARKRYHEIVDKITELWQRHCRFEEREKMEKELFEAHPRHTAADPDCEECHGVGTHATRYNPKSKWDWYAIGGRWPGFLDFTGYDPRKDKDNYETCFLCQGTGQRNDDIGQKARAEDPEYTCNGCNGEGKMLKWQLKPVGYAAPVSEILAHIEQDKKKDLIPFAIVTEEGWYERGEMHWFAIVADEKNQADWKEEATKILKRNWGKVAVVVDCHI